jgi:hypothetical protein
MSPQYHPQEKKKEGKEKRSIYIAPSLFGIHLDNNDWDCDASQMMGFIFISII